MKKASGGKTSKKGAKGKGDRTGFHARFHVKSGNFSRKLVEIIIAKGRKMDYAS